MDLFDVPDQIKGMVQSNPKRTSVKAALKVKRVTLRQRVLDWAQSVGAAGLCDDDLKAAHPNTPESSVRLRRSELTLENILLDTGRTRPNRFGSEEIVWVHRDFHHNPPPIVERVAPVSKAKQIETLQKRVDQLESAMQQAICLHEQGGDFSSTASDMSFVLQQAL